MVADETCVGDGLLDALTEGEEVLVASVEEAVSLRKGVRSTVAYGLPSYHTLATPTIGFWKSLSSSTPSVAYSMAYTMTVSA